jgi:hypothetical protein
MGTSFVLIVNVEDGELGLRVFDDGWGVRRFNVEWGVALEDSPEGSML